MSGMNTVWTEEWPTKPGRYWFYGWRHGRTHSIADDSSIAPELHLVKVRKCSNSMLFVIDSSFWDKSEGGIGMFCVADLPQVPDVSGMVPKKAKGKR